VVRLKVELVSSFVLVGAGVTDGVVVLDLNFPSALIASLQYAILLHIVVELAHILLGIKSVWIVVTEVIVVEGSHSGEW
jgi:hypothetical protein